MMQHDFNRANFEALEPRQMLTTVPSLVPTFGTGGIVEGNYRATQDSLSAAVQSNGDYVVVGDTAAAGAKKAGFITRLTPAGKVDTTFGTKGVTFLDFSTKGDTIITSVQIEKSDQKIVVAGIESPGSGDLGFVARYTTKGVLDTTFGVKGITTLNFGTYSGVSSILIQPSGKIDAVGGGFSTSFSNFGGGLAVAQLTTAGKLDTTFNHTGIFITSPGGFSAEVGTSLTLGTNGDLYIAAAKVNVSVSIFPPSISISSVQFEVLAVKSTGVLDTAFGTAGRAVVSFGRKFEFATSIGLDNAKHIVVGGTSADGIIAFGTPLPVGAGTSLAPAAKNASFAVARLTLAGKLDTTFNKTGKVLISFGTGRLNGCSSIGVEQDGDIMLAGGSEVTGGATDVAMAKVLASGALDTTFGTKGIFISHTASHSTGVFSMILIPVPKTTRNASAYLSYYYGFYTGHSKLDASIGETLDELWYLGL